MNLILENDKLKVTVSTRGAELISIIRKSDQREMIWTGDEAYWSGHAPILFPACGGLWNGTYKLRDKEYKMPKHGFVRDMEWTHYRSSMQNLGLTVKDTPETRVYYPYLFRLEIMYTLEDSELICTYRVHTSSCDIMPFQIGGHPSVLLPMEGDCVGYLKPIGTLGVPLRVNALTIVRVGEQGCWREERYPIPQIQNRLIPICEKTFAHEALIIDHQQVSGFEVYDANERLLATISSPAPVFLLWQPQGLLSPFVCVEPWYGLCDQEGKSTQLIERPYSQCGQHMNTRQNELFRYTVAEE